MYWQFKPENVRAPLTKKQWSRRKLFRKAAFHPEYVESYSHLCSDLICLSNRVEESDIERAFRDREKLVKNAFTSITLKFTVKGEGEGDYSAVIANYGENKVFYLDAVYRRTKAENRARINISLPGRLVYSLIIVGVFH